MENSVLTFPLFSCTQFPLLFIFYINVVYLLQLMIDLGCACHSSPWRGTAGPPEALGGLADPVF